MRSVFVGTVEISWHCLRTLLEMGEEVVTVLTMPRERAPLISAYQDFEGLALEYGVTLHRASDINGEEARAIIERSEAEIVYVIGWPRLVKRPILEMPPRGCLGIHASLLPRYRGGAPVNWGLINGESEWGVTLLYLDEGPDTGDIIAQERFPIEIGDTCATVYAKATAACTRVLRRYVPLVAERSAPRVAQDHARASVYPQRKPHQGEITWKQSSRRIYDWIRALTHPYPGAFTFLADGPRVMVWRAETPENDGGHVAAERTAPGTVLAVLPGRGVVVQAEAGTLVLQRLQTEDEDELDGDAWAHRRRLRRGQRFVMSVEWAAPSRETRPT